MKTVWKYILTPEATLEMPVGAKILSVQAQQDEVVMWALVDTEAKLEKRGFLVYGTGNQIPYHNVQYLGTAQLSEGSLVFHVFEVVFPKVAANG